MSDIVGKIVLNYIDEEDLRTAIDGQKWKNAVTKLEEFIHHKIKYCSLQPDSQKVLEEVRDELFKIIDELNLRLPGW